jgi:hypothetical protein
MKEGNETKQDTQTFSGWARRLLETSAHVPLEALGFLGSPHRYRRRAPPAGATPGDLAVPEGAPPPRIRVVTHTRDRLEEHEPDDTGQLTSFLGTDHVTWIDLQGFGDEALLHRIRDTLDIHPLPMSDVVNVPQRPKTEAYGDRLLIVTRMELYLSSISHRLNETMKTLTVVASIFIPLTFLTSVYAMNFDYMPELRWRWGYPAVWSLMIGVALGLLAWFRRRGWIERGGHDDGDG